MRLPTITALLAATAGGLLLGAPAALGDGEREPKIKILGPQGRLNFEVRPRDACDSFATVPVVVRFRGAGVRRTFVLDEPCGDWETGVKRAPNVRFTPEDGTSRRAGRLRLAATGERASKRRYRYEIEVDGERVERGVMKVDVRKRDDGEVERYVYVDD